MRYRNLNFPLGLAVLLIAIAVPVSFAQKATVQWLRVVSNEDSFVEVDWTSLLLEPNGVFRATFRTTLLNRETIPERPGVKYQNRLDTIQFNYKDERYRIIESKLLDASDVLVSSPLNRNKDWKPLRGVGGLFLRAASQLAPFGIWRVVSYRYASGDPPADDDPPELKSLVGASILLQLDRVQVGQTGCSSPVFEPKTITNDEFVKRSGSPLTSLGLPPDRVDAIMLGCTDRNKFSSPSFILRLPDEKGLMLWEGVLLEIERPGNPFRP